MPCPSEPKLGNVTTGLQGDSVIWLANLILLGRPLQKISFHVNLIEIKKNSSKNETVQFYTHTKIKNGVPLRGLNAMPFRTEARKCNHWATGGLRDLVRKFNDAYMHMQSIRKMCCERNGRPNGD